MNEKRRNCVSGSRRKAQSWVMSSSENEAEKSLSSPSVASASSPPTSPIISSSEDQKKGGHTPTIGSHLDDLKQDNDVDASTSSNSPSRASGASTPINNNNNGALNNCDSDQNESNSSASKPQSSPGGRLKFYKDGVLCLELSHENGGEKSKTKWVQIRSKTVYPTIVHVTKDASIPSYLSGNCSSRIETPNSHSLSDDASSILSSPRIRDSVWKQPVPQQRISIGLQFYMKPAKCVFNLRQYFKKTERIRRGNTNVILTNLSGSNENTDSSNAINSAEFKCICDSINAKQQDAETLLAKTESVQSNSPKKDSKEEEEGKENNVVSKSSSTKDKSSRIEDLIKNLSSLAETRKSISGGGGGSSSSSREDEVYNNESLINCGVNYKQLPLSTTLSTKQPTTQQKKRAFKEVETFAKGSDSSSPRPKRKSPNISMEKTILSVPGYSPGINRKNISRIEDFSTSGGKNEGKKTGKNAKNSNSPHLGAKSTSNTSSKCKSELVHNTFTSGYPTSAISELNNSRELDEEALFHQQTMSKAISYTINSLLRANSNTNPSQGQDQSLDLRTSASKGGNLPNNHASPGEPPEEKDKTSFLRHLLDTSDPIPVAKSKSDIKNAIKISGGSSSSSSKTDAKNVPKSSSGGLKSSSSNSNLPSHLQSNDHSSISNSNSKNKSSPTMHSSRSNTKSTPTKNSGNKQQSHKSNSHRESPTTSSSNSNSNANAATAAALHYNSLLNSSFLPHLGNPAALAALFSSQQHVPPTSMSSFFSPQHLASLQFAAAASAAASNPLGIWPGFFHPGAGAGASQSNPFSQSPLSANILEDLHSLAMKNSGSLYHQQAAKKEESSSSSTTTKRSNASDRQLNLSQSSANLETPLNLCKKPRPN